MLSRLSIEILAVVSHCWILQALAASNIAPVSFSLEEEVFPCSFPFCADGANCAHKKCSGCPFNCYRGEQLECHAEAPHCMTFCTPETTSLTHCSECVFSGRPAKKKCDLGTFLDITKSALSGEDADHWNQWLRPGKPFFYYMPPSLVDVDGDSVLDLFTPMHGFNNTRLNKSIEDGFGSPNFRIQLGLGVFNRTSVERPIYYRDASSRIIVDDPWRENMAYSGSADKHGELVVDLDNDGIRDILIVSGGMSGREMEFPESRAPFLFFGEKNVDEESGKEIIIFRGGRKRAIEAGIPNRMGRGRFIYLLDVNGDGLLDVFLNNHRRVDNDLAPGSLYINQGNRTWRKDPGMSEFAEAMILTDADGDSIANEFLMIRGYCFPHRKNPYWHKDYGPFPDNVKEFCSTKPIGSTAVYKFNNSTQQMEEISPKFFNVTADTAMQPQCCPHGVRHSDDYGCAATSIASGDLDNDGIVDHVFLYNRRIEFFFSSDRPIGELPIEKKFVGRTINLPQRCAEGVNIRLIDIDNSGKLDLVVLCKNIASVLVYSQGIRKDNWKLRNSCNDYGSLGDIVFSHFNATHQDLLDACDKREKDDRLEELCEQYQEGELDHIHHAGWTLADINNDGFMDAIIVSKKRGYMKFLLYQPSKKSRRNKHISFRLIGDGKEVNLYGIGATIVLFTKQKRTEKEFKQFREISSYQHATDTSGRQDERVIFGLGQIFSPVKLFIQWPNGVKQTLWLKDFDKKMPLYPAIDVTYPGKNSHFRIRNKMNSSTGENLCLSDVGGVGPGSNNVQAVDCADDDLEGSTYFKFNDWGMLESCSSPGLCLIYRIGDKNVFLKNCKAKRSKYNSWHHTRDGFLRWSGSSMVLSLKDVITGGIPIVQKMDMGQKNRQWFLDSDQEIP